MRAPLRVAVVRSRIHGASTRARRRGERRDGLVAVVDDLEQATRVAKAACQAIADVAELLAQARPAREPSASRRTATRRWRATSAGGRPRPRREADHADDRGRAGAGRARRRLGGASRRRTRRAVQPRRAGCSGDSRRAARASFQIRAPTGTFPSRIGDTGVATTWPTRATSACGTKPAGTPLRIAAETDRKAHRTHEDLLAALLRFDSGIVGVLEVNWLTPTKVRQLAVTGERRMFVVDYLEQHLTLYENARERALASLDVFDGVTENVVRYAILRASASAAGGVRAGRPRRGARGRRRTGPARASPGARRR